MAWRPARNRPQQSSDGSHRQSHCWENKDGQAGDIKPLQGPDGVDQKQQHRPSDGNGQRKTE
jgi:hypothetical protein